MQFTESHPYPPDDQFDGGDLDCGNGLLLLIRRHIDPLPPGALLEIRSTEPSVDEDLPAWCRMTGNQLVSATRAGTRRSFLICKGAFQLRREGASGGKGSAAGSAPAPGLGLAKPVFLDELPSPAPAPAIPELAVMGIGSWPRPRWMRQAIQQHLSGQLDESAFQETADDAVRLCVEAQLRADADVITDGEQRRDSYASFVGGILDNCQLIPLADLLPYVEDPNEFERELRALDVPAGEIRHPAVFGPLGRSRPLAVHELAYVKQLTARPIKVALPGPYLLTRTMWLECMAERAYASRDELARDVVRILREELHCLLAEGAALVQFDEPVLTEVVYGTAAKKRSFMCGALSEKRDPQTELGFATELLQEVLRGIPWERTGLHVCRGNWTRDESVALSGDYRPLLSLLQAVPVGYYFLELCTPRAGELEVLAGLPDAARIGVGVVNPKRDEVESVEEIVHRVRRAVDLFGRARVLLNPDCGFATFADNPVTSAEIASGKLRNMRLAAERVRASE